MQVSDSYGQFCPVAMAAEIFCTRWTPLILREMAAGSTRFNDLRRGLPRISPTLLSKRLKELELAGILRRAAGAEDVNEYRLTPAGEDLKDVVFGLGLWGQRWIEAQSSLRNLDPSLLMWDMRRNVDPTPLPARRCVIQFVYQDQSASRRNWWLVVQPVGGTDLCRVDPGFDVDLYVATDLRTMTAVWMGLRTVADATGSGDMRLTGDKKLQGPMQQWLGLSPFAGERKLAAN